MRVVYFGSYNPKYSRNRILMEGLRRNGVEVVEVNSRAHFLKKYWELFKTHRQWRGRYAAMVVGFPGFIVMPLARMLATGPIIFDAFLSYYDSNIFDRKLYSPSSLRARFYYWLDKISCRLADMVLLDTQAHIDYFARTFALPPKKFRRVYIGADDQYFKPSPLPHNGLIQVLFWGTYIPLQGVDIILQAAQLLLAEPIRFTFIGDGPSKPAMVELARSWDLKNVEFLDKVDPSQVQERLFSTDIALGIFGKTDKTKRVVPNKVYEALAAARPVLTAITPATEEALVGGQDYLGCRPADPADLAEKIKVLAGDRNLQERLAAHGFATYQSKFSPSVLGAELKEIVSELSHV